MTLRTVGKRVCLTIVAVIAIALLLGGILGQPVLISFVETGSMSPTLEPGDGFIAVPEPLAPVETGDVVVFQSEQLHGGDLVTHRVVDETDQGYITQGDANIAPDQSGGEEPPVKDEQIVAVALQLNGEVVVIPGLGDAVGAIYSVVEWIQLVIASLIGLHFQGGQGMAIVVLMLMLLWYGVEVWRERNVNQRERQRSRGSRDTSMNGHVIVLALVGLVVLGATLAMVAPSGTTQYNVVSAEFDEEGPRVIPAGQSETTTHAVGNGGVLPSAVFFESSDEQIEIEPSQMNVDARSDANASVTLTAPPETGYTRHYITEYHYLGVLPTSVIERLYHIHPWAPIAVIDALVALPYYAVGIRLIGTRSLRIRRYDHEKPLTLRARRRIRQLY